MRQDLCSIFSDKIAVFTAHAAVQKNADTAYAYEQESNFFWLTGITEQGWQLIVDGFTKKAWLVAPDVSEQQRIFDGSLSYDDARSVSGVEEVVSVDEGANILDELAKSCDTVWSLDEHPHADHFEFIVNPAPAILWERLSGIFTEVKGARELLSRRRAIKSTEEVRLIQQAINSTVDAFSSIHENINSLRSEYEIEAEFNYSFTKSGTQGHAYDPIVASAANACTLHYGKNKDQLPENGLVLLDVGVRVGGYAADITRTYAVGTPTQRQIAVHAAVQKAHFSIIDLLTPGLGVREYHDRVDEIMKEALRSLDLLHSEDDYRKYFPHAISHGLGVDVHDSLGKPDALQPGMILTVEPGIYIPEEGIGVRIEDDILITETGNRNLSAALSTGL